jgi:hypothetical protein
MTIISKLQVFKYIHTDFNNSGTVHEEYKNKIGTSNNMGRWNQLKIMQGTVSGKRINELQKTATLGAAHMLQKNINVKAQEVYHGT